MKRLLTIHLILGLLTSPQVFAQEFPDDDFDDAPMMRDEGNNIPPPPPPPPIIDEQGNLQAPSGAPSLTPPPPSNNGSSFGSRSRLGRPPEGSGPKNLRLSDTSRKNDLAHAQPEDITDENFPDLIESFDYPNADIKDVIKAISELTGKNFILDNNVSGKITIIAPTRITVAEAYKAFLSALAVNSLTIVPVGKFLKITQSMQARRNSIETYAGSYYPTADVMITRIVQLKYISAKDLNERLRQLVTKDGELNFYEQTNSLIIADYGSNVERLAKIIDELDRPGFEEQLEVMILKHAKARDIADIISQVINKESSGGKSSRFAPRIPRFNQPGQSKGGGSEQLSMVAPDERTNSLIVLGNRAGIDKVRGLVKKLDFRLSEDSGGVFVYYVKYGEAESIAKTLNGVANDPSKNKAGSGAAAQNPLAQPSFLPPMPGDESAAMFLGEVKITADKLTNTLVVTASKTDYEVVKSILAKLDIPRDQVYVDAVIMDISANRSNAWGVNLYQFGNDGAGNAVGRSGYSTNSLSDFLTPPTSGGEGILSFATGDALTLTGPTGSAVKITSLAAFIKFLTSTTDSSILSNPRVVASNYEESEIEVGQKVPVSTVTSSGANGSTSQGVQTENASIKLTLTPFISPKEDTVRMKVSQIVSEVADVTIKAKNLADNAQTLATRSVKTNISVHNGDTAVIGGLIRSEDKVLVSKVPLLGDIPILGWLFKGQTTTRERRNLVVFITPKILRSTADSHKVFDRHLSERIEFVKEHARGVDPNGKFLDSLPRASEQSRLELPEPSVSATDTPSDAPEGKTTGQVEGHTQELIEETLETF